MKVYDIYKYIDSYAPFKFQDSFDNCGLNVGNMDAEITKICLCCDITKEVIMEAADKGANLIISHHPVIFDAIKELQSDMPAFLLVQNGINALCCHTSYDVSPIGLTNVMIERLELPNNGNVLHLFNDNGTGYGKFCNLDTPTNVLNLVKCCKKAFDTTVIRYYDSGKAISRVGICSGAGSSELKNAILWKCDVLITGDIKWETTVTAANYGISLIDAGHFFTENTITAHLQKMLKQLQNLPETFIADKSRDLMEYFY